VDPRTVVRPQARALVHGALPAEERVLVVGATGWFGCTMLALLAGHRARVLPVATRTRDISLGGASWSVHGWEDEEVREFSPTVVLNFAFLTRDKEAALGEERFVSALAELNSRLVRTTELPSVRAMLTVSSGAAVHVPEGPHLPVGAYGEAKRAEEQLALALVDQVRSVVVARAWSLSGALVQRPHDYAFSDLVLQARSGTIEVKAPSEVWRRYCGVDDYLAVCTASLMMGSSGVIDSGGPVVELRDLARMVADRFAGTRPEVRSEPVVEPVRRYHSDDSTWQGACSSAGYSPATLGEQIDFVQTALP
jgi:nucleoside-diphosphate-sugar epimerase